MIGKGLLHQLPAPPPGKSGWPWTEETDPGLFSPDIDWLKISIVTPSYNQGAFIEETIRSVLLQNYPNLEYVVIDGGSTDESVEIIRKYEKWITYWLSEKDKGQSNAINKGFQFVTGDILAWINSDDFYEKSSLGHVATNWISNSPHLLVGIGHKVNLDRKIIYSPHPKKVTYDSILHWMEGNNFMQPAAFFSKQAWKNCGPLNEDFHFCMDVDLWLKITQKYPASTLNETLAYAYTHPNAKTTAYKARMKMETSLLIALNGNIELARKESFKIIDSYEKKIQQKHSIREYYHKAKRMITKNINNIFSR